MVVHHNVKLVKLTKQRLLRDTAHPTQLKCRGALIADRSKWLDEGSRFGKSRFKDRSNSVKQQRDRIVALGSVKNN